MKVCIIPVCIILFNLTVFLGIYFGVYTPYTKRYLYINCQKFNDTFSISHLENKVILFKGSPSKGGPCILDTQSNKIILYPLDYINLVQVFGTILATAIIVFTIPLINFFRKK